MASNEPNPGLERPSRRERLFGRPGGSRPWPAKPSEDRDRADGPAGGAQRPAEPTAPGRPTAGRDSTAGAGSTAGDSVLRPSGPARPARGGDGPSDRPSEEARAVTGVAGSDLERRAATVLAAELESRGRKVQVQDVKVPAGPGASVAVHALIALAGSLIGLASPLIGAAIALIAAFSFYAERALGLPLIGRALPRRRTRNVISPPLGPGWATEVDAIFVAGYDAPASYPVGAWLERRFDGRLTTDRILLWGAMILTFVSLLLRAAEIDATWVQAIQAVGAALLLGAVAAQVDRRLAGTPLGVDEDLAPARDLIAALEEAEREGDGAGIALCLVGAESADAAGAEALFGDRRLEVKPDVAVIGLVRAAAEGRPEITAREGDLSTVAMSAELAAESPLKPKRVIIRRATAAGRARRRGARAVTVVGRGDLGVDLVLDLLDGSLAATDRPATTPRRSNS